MKLSDMTEDQAIELCLREVPEIDLSKIDDDDGSLEYASARRALFFRAAWVWLAEDNEWLIVVVQRPRESWAVFHTLKSELVVTDLPTEIHALVAACLLAKGKVVP